MKLKQIFEMIENYGRDYASYWGCALAGEVGEACNLIKKFERDGGEWDRKQYEVFLEKLGEELADVFIYTVLTAEHFEIDFEFAILQKLYKLKERRENNE